MHRGRLLACTAVVLVAHGALIEALAHHGLRLLPEAEAARREGQRLILLGRDQVDALTLSRVDRSSAQPASEAPAPPPNEALAGDAAASLRTPPATRRAGLAIYRAPSDLDVAARPRSAPDLAMLNGLPWSGLPVRLRLFIDAQGTVVDTQVLQSAEADAVTTRVRAMFFATGFTAGLVNGQPVPSYKDIEITVGTPP